MARNKWGWPSNPTVMDYLTLGIGILGVMLIVINGGIFIGIVVVVIGILWGVNKLTSKPSPPSQDDKNEDNNDNS